MERNQKGKRENRKTKPGNLGAATEPKRSSKRKTKSTARSSENRLQLSSGGKSLRKAPKPGRKLPKGKPSSVRKGKHSAVEYLAGHWESIPRPEKIQRLQSLIDAGWKIRRLARALKVVSESRIRQLTKSGKVAGTAMGRPGRTATAPPAHGAGEGNSPARHESASISAKPKSGTDVSHVLSQRQVHGETESPNRPNPLRSPRGISSSAGKQPLAAKKKQERRVTVRRPAMDSRERETLAVEETNLSAPETATRKGSRQVKPTARPTAPDYAIRDPEVAGKLVAAWIRSNFKYAEWPEVIADYTTAYWFNRPSVRKEADLINEVPAGLRPLEVISYCLSDSIKAELDQGLVQVARRKWFVCWASILLPDPVVRRKAVEIAEQFLNRPAARWSYLSNDPQLTRPTPCIRSQGTPLADFLERLTKYVDYRSLLQNGGLQQAEVEEALRYAAATLREGSPPPLD